jgi:hypothetical protein
MHPRTLLLVSAIATCFVFVEAVQAETVNYTAVTASAGVNTPSNAHDGIFPADYTEWTTTTAWWTGFEQSIVFEFDGVHALTGYQVSLDNNDSYAIQFSLDGNYWGLTGNQYDIYVGSGEGDVWWGMDTFAGTIPSVRAAYARIVALDGDGYHSVGELSFNSATPVPEPESYALMLAGLGLVGFAVRRQRNA